MNQEAQFASKSSAGVAGAFDVVRAFLDGLGIKLRVEHGATGFLQDVAIANGSLIAARRDDDLAGEILHEAGHLAVLPERFRGTASGNLSSVFKLMSEWMDTEARDLEPDDIQIRAILQSGETEAIAWSYAAASSLGLDTRIPFYRGFDGAGLDLHDQVASGCYFGVHGLAAGGMTELPRPWATTPFPRMKRWLQI